MSRQVKKCDLSYRFTSVKSGVRVPSRPLLKPNLGHLSLKELRPDHLQTLYTKKLDEGLSKRTVQHMHAVIRRSLMI